MIWNLTASLSLLVFLLVMLWPQSSAADPVTTITVNFTIGGADASRAALGAAVDPVYGTATTSGTFSFSSAIIPAGGGVLIRALGLPIESLSLAWAGVTWTRANAGVTDLRFGADGSLTGWALGGAPFGFNGITTDAGPDVYVVQPSFPAVVPQCCFNYTTASGGQIYSGRLLSVDVTQTPGGNPSPTPEPGSLLLVASGGAGLAFVRRHRASR